MDWNHRLKPASQKETITIIWKPFNKNQYMEKCNYTPIWKHNIKPVYVNMLWYPHMEAQFDPKYSFHQIVRTNFPKYSYQQIEPTGKSSDVLNIQWHFFKRCPGV